MSLIVRWWKRRRFLRACALVHAAGLQVVRIKEIAGTCYVVMGDGSYKKLTNAKRP